MSEDEQIRQDFEGAFLPLTAEAQLDGDRLRVQIQDHEPASFQRLSLHGGKHREIIET